MLFRGDTPLSPDEQIEFEIETELLELQREGLLAHYASSPTGSVWTKTLRGMRVLDCPFHCSE